MNFDRTSGHLNRQAAILREIVERCIKEYGADRSKAMQAIGAIEGVAMALTGFNDAPKIEAGRPVERPE